jgi:hypothetical protein
MLDGRYTVAINRIGSYRGELTLLDGTALIHRQEFTLMYDAIFGPDVDDVATWQEVTTTVADSLKEPPEMRAKERSAGGPIT